ncbi:MAG: tetratricopeptide repeat protein [Thermodesulfobacteriota bacterium]
MKRSVLCIILVILIVLGVNKVIQAQEALKGAAADLEKGWQTLDIPLLEKTLKTFEEMAKKNPKDSLAPYHAARAHFAVADCLDIKSDKEFDQTGDGEKHIDAALDLIKASLSIKEDSLDTNILKFQVIRRKIFHVSFPRLMMYVGDRKAAYNKAIELAPDNPTVQLLSALEAAEGGWPQPPPEKCVVEFEKLLKKDPKIAEAYYEIGYIWEKAKKTDDAKKNYKKALELDSNHHWAKKRLKSLASGSGA